MACFYHVDHKAKGKSALPDPEAHLQSAVAEFSDERVLEL
jgi:hypothetical protein